MLNPCCLLDNCLVTPIVGKRYHASNLPDYDLCSDCFKNYAGTNVVFESVELGKETLLFAYYEILLVCH